jgi:U3 small nucleolar RNA-associated protein 23
MALVGSSTSTETSRKKKKGPKGPNPLSVKKKKNVGSTPELSAKSKRKAREKEFENDVTPAEDGMHTAKVGEKRKRGETSESLEGGEKNEEREDVQMHSGQNGVGKKRKRRRKMAAGSNHDP